MYAYSRSEQRDGPARNHSSSAIKSSLRRPKSPGWLDGPAAGGNLE
jgi:hypothetical protein